MRNPAMATEISSNTKITKIITKKIIRNLS